MTVDVRVLIAADTMATDLLHSGDVVDILKPEQDWGYQTVAPDWIRLTIERVPGTSEEAHTTIEKLLEGWNHAFVYSDVGGASEGHQRYRVSIRPEEADNFDMRTKSQLHTDVMTPFSGSFVTSEPMYFEFDSDKDIPLNEIGNVLAWAGYRRFRLSEGLVTAALAGVSDGEPAPLSREWNWVKNKIVDKMKE